MKDSFSNRMRQAMAMQNMKQTELVEKTGLTKSAVSQYYSGKFEPKQKGIYLIAKALNVNEAWLMGFDVEMEKQSVIKRIKNSFEAFQVLDNKILVELEKNEKIGLSLSLNTANKLLIEITKDKN